MFFSHLGKKNGTPTPKTSDVKRKVTKVKTRKPIVASVSKSPSPTKRASLSATKAAATTAPVSSSKPATPRKSRRKTPNIYQLSKSSLSEVDTEESERDVSSSLSTPGLYELVPRDIVCADFGSDKLAASIHITNASESGNLSMTDIYEAVSSDKSLSDRASVTALSCDFAEEYSLIKPKVPGEFEPVREILSVMEMTALHFVDQEAAEEIKHPVMDDCIMRRFRRAYEGGDLEGMKTSMKEFDVVVKKQRTEGALLANLKKLTAVPQDFAYFLLNQVYSRIVSPESKSLRDYKAFSNNVYGELMPPFMSTVFQKTDLQPDSVFVDLGSGVGNCTLQAALEVGCESWGCEVMTNASSLAEKQKIELYSRAKMFGIKTGDVHLVASSFVHNDEVHSAISRADVLLVNNYAFDGTLNAHLLDMFLDLKEGCKIVSLKSFVPVGHVISEHNIESPVNILKVQKLDFYSGSVSWTAAGGTYYISTVDRSAIKAFLSKGGY
ncbi:Histone-lysine N-methyltransferase, H3 lysine-79 specific [Yarrowia sp. C11]|nr:Histone-lysine N-methyltransferase, H3 lysine-79 specific [Yarrowia sp. C11]KAG5370549.1 Histone-lysine N-methyltransferase, H3 lysine-79 specific [Yarrowia sp. E02]